MGTVKTGKAIRNENDVQNLAISIIDRQRKVYRKEEICELAKHSFKYAKKGLFHKRLREILTKMAICATIKVGGADSALFMFLIVENERGKKNGSSIYHA